MIGRPFLFLLLPALLLLSACSIELQHGLTESDANEVYVLLNENGIPAEKHRDGREEGVFMITVPKKDAAISAKLLREYSLPRVMQAGFTGISENKGMIPTQVEERAMFLQALGGEISNALNKVDGVLEASAIVNIPERNELAQPDQKPKTTAAVFVKYRHTYEGRPPLEPDAIRAFTAASVEDLKPEDVQVIMTQAQPPSAEVRPEGQLQKVLGLQMTASSAKQFRVMALVSLLALIVIIGFTLWTFMRGASGPATRPRR